MMLGTVQSLMTIIGGIVLVLVLLWVLATVHRKAKKARDSKFQLISDENKESEK